MFELRFEKILPKMTPLRLVANIRRYWYTISQYSNVILIKEVMSIVHRIMHTPKDRAARTLVPAEERSTPERSPARRRWSAKRGSCGRRRTRSSNVNVTFSVQSSGHLAAICYHYLIASQNFRLYKT